MKVMVFGTFDILHLGHINMLHQAKKLGDKLIVVVARDETVKKFKKEKPLNKLDKRIEAVKNAKLADKVISGDILNYFKSIKKEKPDIIALGYDQKYNIKELKEYLQKKQKSIKLIRLKSYKPNIYKSKILKINKK